ncbi:MAG: serine hydrolase domain-containing protein [Acidimicrobiia bacterium]
MTAEVDALLTRARQEVDAGLLPSCQIALARNGELEVFEAFGDATTDTRYIVYSATKAFVASLVWVLIGEGLIDVSKRVVDYIPEFAPNGKDVVTVEQVMLHTSGFPYAPLTAPAMLTREGRVARMADWRLNWEPDSTYEYHPESAHWVLAEIIDRVTGADYRDLLEARITRPAGIPYRILGTTAPVATVTEVGEEATPDELEAVLGVRELPMTTVTPEGLIALSQDDLRPVGHPGGGGVMTAADLAHFYQALLHDPEGVWKPDVLADAVGTVRNDKPERWTGVTAHRGLGVVIAGDDGRSPLRGFGHTNSARTFGHNGAGGQIAWADPESGLSFAYLTNGLDAHVIRQGRRGIGLSSRAAVC